MAFAHLPLSTCLASDHLRPCPASASSSRPIKSSLSLTDHQTLSLVRPNLDPCLAPCHLSYFISFPTHQAIDQSDFQTLPVQTQARVFARRQPSSTSQALTSQPALLSAFARVFNLQQQQVSHAFALPCHNSNCWLFFSAQMPLRRAPARSGSGAASDLPVCQAFVRPGACQPPSGARHHLLLACQTLRQQPAPRRSARPGSVSSSNCACAVSWACQLALAPALTSICHLFALPLAFAVQTIKSSSPLLARQTPSRRCFALLTLPFAIRLPCLQARSGSQAASGRQGRQARFWPALLPRPGWLLFVSRPVPARTSDQTRPRPGTSRASAGILCLLALPSHRNQHQFSFVSSSQVIVSQVKSASGFSLPFRPRLACQVHLPLVVKLLPALLLPCPCFCPARLRPSALAAAVRPFCFASRFARRRPCQPGCFGPQALLSSPCAALSALSDFANSPRRFVAKYRHLFCLTDRRLIFFTLTISTSQPDLPCQRFACLARFFQICQLTAPASYQVFFAASAS